MTLKKKIMVAMSGGVDSSVAAAFLKEAGHDVAGATIRTWSPGECEKLGAKACCSLQSVEDARRVAGMLDIPFYVFNFEKEFRRYVMDYFAAEYQKARTPNPCILCNEQIKFWFFYQRARLLGYDGIATGHYAQVMRCPKTGGYYIAEGEDKNKDQSYVLFSIPDEVLPHVEFPMGKQTKEAVRAHAKALNLPVEAKPESQDICFVPDGDYGAFLKNEYLKTAGKPEGSSGENKGVIRTQDGKVLGHHDGYFRYTIGQRRGLGVAYSERLYVIDIYPETNEVIVGTKEDITGCKLRVDRVHWFLKPGFEQNFFHVKIRSQHSKAPAEVLLLGEDRVEVRFQEPQEAITPGQAAVFYDGEAVCGGGWIEARL